MIPIALAIYAIAIAIDRCWNTHDNGGSPTGAICFFGIVIFAIRDLTNPPEKKP